MVINIMAQRAFTILSLDQVKSLGTSLADETARTEFSNALKAQLAEYAKRESANRRGGRKPAELFFTGEFEVRPIFDRADDGKPIVPQTEEEWANVRFTTVYPYSTKEGGKAVGFFFGGQLFKEDAEGKSGHGTINAILNEFENSVERVGMTNEQAGKATAELLKKQGKVACETVVVGKNRSGGDLYGYNLNKAE